LEIAELWWPLSGARVVYVIVQTDQFQKLGKKLARKCEFKKSDLYLKTSDFLIFFVKIVIFSNPALC